MPIKVNSRIFPYRVSLKAKENWELEVEIQNNDPKAKIVSVKITLPEEATFKAVGEAQVLERQFESLKPSQTQIIKEKIFISRGSRTGNFTAKINVTEHYNDFEHILKEFRSDFAIRIVD
ncbi:MAG: hypothetical protein NUV67_03900 [archaeon]|nr:hypothetical protein [archaeon]